MIIKLIKSALKKLGRILNKPVRKRIPVAPKLILTPIEEEKPQKRERDGRYSNRHPTQHFRTTFKKKRTH